MESEVEALSLSIVREFLSRKKCKDALQRMDEEWPRDERSISNRTKLAQALSIESWMDKNKSHSPKFKTMLEVVLYNVCLINKEKPKDTHSIVTDIYRAKTNIPIQSRPFTADTSTISSATKRTQSVEVEDLDDLNMDELKTSLTIHKPSRITREHAPLGHGEMQESDFFAATNVRSTSANIQNQLNVGGTSMESIMVESPFADEMISTKKNIPKSLIMSEEPILHSDDVSNGENMQHFANKNQYSQLAYSRKNFSSNETQKEILTVAEEHRVEQSKTNFHGLKSTESNVSSKFDYETAKKLRELIFGSTKHGFSTEWTDQSFTFCDCTDRPEMLRFGIIQKKGGPCGILAAVQAVVLKNILFGNNKTIPSSSNLNVSSSVRTNALVDAITSIIWNAGNKTSASLLVLSPRKQFSILAHEYRCDGVTESAVLFKFSTKSELQSAVKKNIRSYEYGKGSCILLLYSAILSRGIETVRADLDEPGGKLMGAHGYCTQEMINLIIIGRATSNAFNNVVRLDQMTLRGVHEQSEIGLLSLFEHYASCKVGSFYKTPKYPIWLICSESHFTVLFGLDMSIVSAYKPPGVFDLYYYDGLANQDEVIVLTIDTSATVNENSLTGELVPPLEHCIRTKWPKVKIDWNDTDPIL